MALLEQIQPIVEAGVSVICLGGSDADRGILQAVAKRAQWAVHHCVTVEDACTHAGGGASAIVVVCDSSGPNAGALRELRERLRDRIRIVWMRTTEAAPPWQFIDEVLSAPLQHDEVRLRFRALAHGLAAQAALRRHRDDRSGEVDKRSAELERLVQDLQVAEARAKSAHLDCIFRLALAAEYKDDDTAGHLQRMSRYSVIIGRALGCNEEQQFTLTYASMMHDVGKISIPDAILMKRGRLNREEWRIMQTHAAAGEKIMAGADNVLMDAAAQIAGGHHEKWNGSGYPRGLRGEEIPLYARIVAVADVFDALTSERCYKGAISNQDALDFMQTQRGKHFDPNVFDAFIARKDAIYEVQRQAASTRTTVASLSRHVAAPVLQELGLPAIELER